MFSAKIEWTCIFFWNSQGTDYSIKCKFYSCFLERRRDAVFRLPLVTALLRTILYKKVWWPYNVVGRSIRKELMVV